MILATQQDVADRLRRNLTADESSDAVVLLEEASVLVEGWLANRGVTYAVEGDVPRAVVIVTSRMVARALTTSVNPGIPEGASQLTAGPFGVRYSDPYSSSVYLAKGDLAWLRTVVPSVTSLTFVSERAQDC